MMNIDETISIYVREQQPLYKLFAGKVQELVYSILRANSVTPNSVTSREKSPSSLKEKLLREGKAYEDPLHEVTDLAGVRIITFFPSDVDRIVPFLETEFTVDKEKSVDKRRAADPSVFGYASVHLIVELTEARCRLPEYTIFKGLKCEIQVRTILQHAWAEIEHDISYKSSEEIPFELRHKFASLAGLLEVADREFEQLRLEQVKVREHIEETIKRDKLDMAVNLDSLTLYLKVYHKEKILPSTNMSRLVRMLHAMKIETVQQLHEILTDATLRRSDAAVEKVRESCPDINGCLLRYFIAIGRHFNLPDCQLGELADCPALVDPEAYRKRRLKAPKGSKNVRGRMGAGEDLPNQEPEARQYKRERRTQMPTTGEKPGKGTYRCRRCSEIVRLDDDTDTLPPCPTCHGTEFNKVD